MDGYAIKFSEKKQWKVIGELTAGKFHDISLSEDDAVLITTGSKIPNHSDNVFPNEDLELKNGFIQLKENAFFKKECKNCLSFLKGEDDYWTGKKG